MYTVPYASYMNSQTPGATHFKTSMYVKKKLFPKIPSYNILFNDLTYDMYNIYVLMVNEFYAIFLRQQKKNGTQFNIFKRR